MKTRFKNAMKKNGKTEKSSLRNVYYFS